MSKAASACSKVTRRAAIAATLASAASPALSAPPDPTFYLIAAHKAAYAALDRACRCVSHLEGQIPEPRRKEWYDEDRGKGIGADDDPRWTTALAVQRAAFDAESRTAWALARACPASVAGAAAVLRYAAEYEDEGCEWPSLPETEDGDEQRMAIFHRSLAAALAAMA